MKLARYHQLLGRLMDGELSGTEDEELGRALKDFPALREDLRQHLVLWEMWSQDQSPERSAQGFVHAWETRLSAEGESAEAFTAAVRSQLEDCDKRGCPEEARPEERRWKAMGLRMVLWFEGLRVFSQRPAKLFWVLSAAMAVLVSAWFATTQSTHAATTIQGGRHGFQKGRTCWKGRAVCSFSGQAGLDREVAEDGRSRSMRLRLQRITSSRRLPTVSESAQEEEQTNVPPWNSPF